MNNEDNKKAADRRAESKNDSIVMDTKLAYYTFDQMNERLAEKRRSGRAGWWNDCTNQTLVEMLERNLIEGDMVDVMALSAMIVYRQDMGIEFERVHTVSREYQDNCDCGRELEIGLSGTPAIILAAFVGFLLGMILI